MGGINTLAPAQQELMKLRTCCNKAEALQCRMISQGTSLIAGLLLVQKTSNKKNKSKKVVLTIMSNSHTESCNRKPVYMSCHIIVSLVYMSDR